MSIPYVIILSDSEDEMELPPVSPVPNPPSDSSSEPEEYVPESESEVESKLKTPPASPYHATYHTSGPRTITRPKKRVAIPRRRGKSPVIAAPSDDPYRGPTPRQEDAKYRWVKDTLADWRKLDVFPPIHEIGESSNAHKKYPFTHEPPHHTIPILIAHTVRQDDRLDHIEDALMEMPGPETMEDIDIQTTTLGQHLDVARADIIDLKHRTKDNALDAYVLEKRLDGVDSRLEEMDAMLRDLIATVKKNIDPKK